jgi:competence protein ComEC
MGRLRLPSLAAIWAAIRAEAAAQQNRAFLWAPAAFGAGAAAALAGLAAGKLHGDWAAAPIAPPHMGMVTIEGWVADVAKPSQTGARLLIAPVRVQGLSPEQTPRRVRIVVPPDAVLGPGSAIRIRALLDPPPGPAAPGAYDFARDAWFTGIGGVGVSKTAPSVIDLSPPPWCCAGRWRSTPPAGRWPSGWRRTSAR